MKSVDWSGIIAHRNITARLDRYIKDDNIPHGMIFVGQDGVGKRMIAIRLAQALMCQRDDWPCQECFSCRLWKDNLVNNRFYLSGNEKISIEQVRQIKSELLKSDIMSGYRVVVIDGIERMTREAANAILKLLEEPKQKIVFIGITVDINNVLPTISSRSVILYFNRLSYLESTELLTDLSSRDQMVKVMMGRPGLYKKYQLLSRDRHIKNVIGFWRLFFASYATRVNMIAKLSKVETDKMAGWLTFWESCLRDYLLWQSGSNQYRWWQDQTTDDIYPKIKLPASRVLALLANLSFLRDNIDRGLNKKLQLVDFFINN
ncbi:MAG: AAA family ATPase [Patescibacteria group bacterium]